MSIKKTNLKYLETTILLFIWMVAFISPILMLQSNDYFNWNMIFFSWNKMVPYLILSLVNHFILIPELFFRKKKMWYFLSSSFLLVVFSFLFSLSDGPDFKMHDDPFMNEQNMKPPGVPPFDMNEDGQGLPDISRKGPSMEREHNLPPGPMPAGDFMFILNHFITALLILGFDVGMRVSFKWSQTEQEKNLLEREKIKNELSFLRNQVSPHFFMNTLNNIHGLIAIDAEKAADAVIRLSRLMRYLLYDCEMEKIPLRQEIEFIKSYVDLMMLRYTSRLKVTLKLPEEEDESNFIKIQPLIFNPLIENAFKYGVSYRQYSEINIELGYSENDVFFTIQNSISPSASLNQLESSGIGLNNLKKRLELLFEKRYTLKVTEDDEFFNVSLKIPV